MKRKIIARGNWQFVLLCLSLVAVLFFAYSLTGGDKVAEAAVTPGNFNISNVIPHPSSDATINGRDPFLVVGNSVQGRIDPKFQDRELELDLWVTAGDIGSLEILPDDVCHNRNYDLIGRGIGYNEAHTDIYIEDKDGTRIQVIDGSSSSSCANFDTSSRASLQSLQHFDEVILNNKKYHKYKVIAKVDLRGSTATGLDPELDDVINVDFINQFRLRVSQPADSYLTIPESGDDDDPNSELGALNISNRNESNVNEQNSGTKTGWYTTIYFAVDPEEGCGEAKDRHIGLYDSDRSFKSRNPIMVEIYSVDRNSYLRNPTTPFLPDDFDPNKTNEHELLFNGAIDEGNERGTQGQAVGSNKWEDKKYRFRAEKIYRIQVLGVRRSGVDSKNWIQIRVPFNQFNALLPCGRKPLVKVYQGGISVGGLFGDSGKLKACTPSQNLSAVSSGLYAHVFGEAGEADGSSVEYGAKVAGEIIGFYSNYPRGQPPPSTYSGRTFANTDNILRLSEFGGQFGRGRCIPNYWRGASGLTADTLAASLDIADRTVIEDNQAKLYQTANFELTNSQPAANINLKATIYVDGDLTIKNDILNNRGVVFEHVNEIKQLYIVVNGDILIDPSVTQIDAVLVAHSEDNATKGRVFTCAFDAGGIDINKKADNQAIITKSLEYEAACNKKLVISGAVVAREIRLGRTFCEVPTASVPCPVPSTDSTGEEINLLPELFIGTPQLPDHGEWRYKSDSITVLPPNL